MKNIATLFAFVCLLFVSQSAYAVNTATVFNGETVESVATEDGTFLSEKATKKQARLEKRIAKVQKKMQKKAAAQDIDFKDDTQKWMWFWIFGWILGALLPIIGLLTGGLGGVAIFSILAGLFATFGTVALVIWLIKKFS